MQSCDSAELCGRMDETRATERALAALLMEHREEIVVAWAGRVHALPDTHFGTVPHDHMRATVGQLLERFAEALDTGSYQMLDTEVASRSSDWLDMGYEPSELSEAFLVCKAAAMPIIRRTQASDSAAWAMAAVLDDCLQHSLGHLHVAFAAECQRRLRHAHARTAMMLDMARAASSTLELDEVIKRVADHIAAAAGVPHCGLMLVDMEHGTITPRLAHMIAAHRGRGGPASGTAEGPPPSLPIAAAGALTRKLIEQQEPVACPNVQVDPLFRQDDVRRSGLKSVLALPLKVGRRVVALAWAYTFDEHHAFSQEEIDLCRGLAEVAALSIENARLYQRVKALAVCEERGRLAQEMHDDLSQTLSAINWRAAAADQLLAKGEIEPAQAALRELKAAARQGYVLVRQSIYALRSSSTVEPDLLAALERCRNGWRSHYDLDVQVEAGQQPLPQVSEEARLQAIRIVQEALSNVAHHAATSQACVRLESDGRRLRIRVEDEGRGFRPPAKGAASDRFGLLIMRERAKSVGGELAVESQPGVGTRVTLWLPLAPGPDGEVSDEQSAPAARPVG
jgi:signal transduction histidine kinase